MTVGVVIVVPIFRECSVIVLQSSVFQSSLGRFSVIVIKEALRKL